MLAPARSMSLSSLLRAFPAASCTAPWICKRGRSSSATSRDGLHRLRIRDSLWRRFSFAPLPRLSQLVDGLSAFHPPVASFGTPRRRRLAVWAWLGMPTRTRLRLPAQARASRRAPARLWFRALVRAGFRRSLSLGDGLGDNTLDAVRVFGEARRMADICALLPSAAPCLPGRSRRSAAIQIAGGRQEVLPSNGRPTHHCTIGVFTSCMLSAGWSTVIRG
jgi:hypothetical protein